MIENGALDQLQRLVEPAEITINGANPWDIQIYRPNECLAALGRGTLGVGEAYMEGWWDSKHLDQSLDRVMRSGILEKVVRSNPKSVVSWFQNAVQNPQSTRRAFQVGEAHYDLGNDLFEAMFDKRMVYSSGYWKDAENLDEAQEDKLELICKKIGLERGMRVLDIGCGFGSFAKYASQEYGAFVTGISVSREQTKYAREYCKDLPTSFFEMDYREVAGEFDRVVSIGMFEAVGRKNFRTFMQVVSDHLVSGGLFLLHTIGTNESLDNRDPWINKYIFPHGEIPSANRIAQAHEGIFVMEDWHNFGLDYDKTLMAWHKNFEDNWDELRPKYGDKFKRVWDFYLLSCAASFRSRRNNLWQIVLSKDYFDRYESVR